MFAAIVGGPSPRSTPAGASIVEIDALRQVAFVVANPHLFEGEWRGIAKAGRLSIVGRIRFDDREALAASLDSPLSTSDGLLCLKAYAKWGDAFLDRLTGDFAFVIWDEAAARATAARDQLGVRALFHADRSGTHFLSDSLGWMLDQQGPRRDLDDVWIGDFLSIGHCLDAQRTAFASVSRLPPAHRLDITAEGSRLRRYWQLDIPEPIWLKTGHAYEERFRELVGKAVRDRLPRVGKIGISMSGGLDSTTLAAFACEQAGRERLFAECMHYERLIPDEEARFGRIAADYLGVELHLRAVDDLIYDTSWRRHDRPTEPSFGVFSAMYTRALTIERAKHAAIWLYGEGPDDAMSFDRGPYLSWLKQRGEWRRLAEALLLYGLDKGPSGILTIGRRLVRRPAVDDFKPEIPPWIEPEFAARLGLADRLRAAVAYADPEHAWHPTSIGAFKSALWSTFFDQMDDEEAMAPIQWRHPYLDLRVLTYLLAVPPVPWARGKRLIRRAMRGRLPAEILRRRKTPLAASPLQRAVLDEGIGGLPPAGAVGAYVDLDRVPRPVAADDLYFRQLLAVHALDHWMGYADTYG